MNSIYGLAKGRATGSIEMQICMTSTRTGLHSLMFIIHRAVPSNGAFRSVSAGSD